ncbi:MAG: hypothetical protein FWD24_02815 [Treponema sp.]|nr:hypothetical protein [Treponema sp.]
MHVIKGDSKGGGFGGIIIIAILLFIILIIIPTQCGRCSKEKKPEEVRATDQRAITVINKTGSRITGYMINTASGAEIQRGQTTENSFGIIIGNNFRRDTVIEVVLIDRAGRIYAKNFEVPLRGNTDTPITRQDRVRENAFTDKFKDLVDWMNRNK